MIKWTALVLSSLRKEDSMMDSGRKMLSMAMVHIDMRMGLDTLEAS